MKYSEKRQARYALPCLPFYVRRRDCGEQNGKYEGVLPLCMIQDIKALYQE